jgi:hypothetical protein
VKFSFFFAPGAPVLTTRTRLPLLTGVTQSSRDPVHIRTMNVPGPHVNVFDSEITSTVDTLSSHAGYSANTE